jgi:SAM-dependent methyltransferase
MPSLIKIPPDEFRRLAVRPPEELELYAYDSFFLREVFWQRLAVLARLLERHASTKGECLDLGTGSGVFLPTLARRFTTVHGADRDVADARNIVAAYHLDNVVLHARDLLAEPFAPASFDAIVAADVLEHFPDTEPIATRLLDWLRDDGVLVTSLPSENFIYVLLRRVFGIEKPPDHYFAGAEVEATLARVGFTPIARRSVPPGLPRGSLFMVTAWRKRTAQRR